MKFLYGIFLFSISFVFTTCSHTTEFGQFAEAECPIPISEELASSDRFTFGYMTVPEIHGDRGKGSIELAIAIFKCRQDSVEGEPLILNSGGPGMSNLEDFIPAFDGPVGDLFLNDRDVVIIELRGLKHSRPNLHTPELEELHHELIGQHIRSEELTARYAEAIRSIRGRFESQGINLSAYNYWETANDIAFVMDQLGYDRFFAFGNSAGTLVAQYLLMEHSDKLAGLVLNAVANVEWGFNQMIVTSINKFESIFSEIENDETLARAYPDLKGRFLHKLDELNENPDTIFVRFQEDQEDVRVVLTGDRVTRWVFSQMYWNTQIPLSLHKIVLGDYSELTGNPGIFLPLQNFSNGSFWCMLLNGWPDPNEAQLLAGSEWEPFVRGMGTMEFSQPFVMNIREILQIEYQPGHIKPMNRNVPALMVNGGEDHVCLPEYPEKLAESFENGYCYIFEGIAHSPIDAGPCAIMMMKQFIDDPDVAPDASCVEEFSEKPAFILP